MTRLLLILFVSLPVQAWDSVAEHPGADGRAAAQIRWRDGQNRDEHRQIWRRTLRIGGLPAAADSDLTLPTYTGSQASYQPVSFLAAKYIHQRPHQPSEFAQLPDFSYSLWDWALGNETCPIDASLLPCHSFLWHMGAVNSNHFPPQSKTFYGYYHELALKQARSCAQLQTQLAGRNDLKPYLLACESEALVLEAIGHHFLQDAWSMGHMWERWGGPDTSDYPLGGYPAALLVGMLSGLMHGARAVLLDYGFSDPNDAMCAPADGVGYLENGASTPGMGDLYLNILSPASTQYREMMGCTVGSLRAVYQAAGQQHGPLGDVDATANITPIDPSADPSADPDRCFGQRATNLAMSIAYAIDFIDRFGNQTSIPLEQLSDGLTIAVHPTLGPIAIPLAPLQLTIIMMGHQIRLEAKDNPLGTHLANGGLPDFLGSKHNGYYNHLAAYVDPDLPWPGGDEHGKALARQFHRAQAKDWCGLFNDGDAELDVNKLKQRVASTSGDERKVACSVCSEFAQRHLRMGTDAGHYDQSREPLCGLVGSPQFVYTRNPDDLDTSSLASQWCGETDTYVEVVATWDAQSQHLFSVGVTRTAGANPSWLPGVPVVVTIAGGGQPPVTLNGVTDDHGWFIGALPTGLSGCTMTVAATVPGQPTVYRRLAVPTGGLGLAHYASLRIIGNTTSPFRWGWWDFGYDISGAGGSASGHVALGSLRAQGAGVADVNGNVFIGAGAGLNDVVRIDSAQLDGQPGTAVATVTAEQAGTGAARLATPTAFMMPAGGTPTTVPIPFTYGRPFSLSLSAAGEAECAVCQFYGCGGCFWPPCWEACIECDDRPDDPMCSGHSFSASLVWGGLGGLAPDARVTSGSGHDWELAYGQWRRGSLCAGDCPTGTQDCGNGCIDTASDVNNCGACGTVCPVPANRAATCTGGVCGVECAVGWKACSGDCIPEANCCSDADCLAPANGTATCTGGACSSGCVSGYKLCMAACIPNASCCTPSDCTPPAHSTATCDSNVCGFTCDANYKACNGDCIALAACCNCALPPANAVGACNAGVCGFTCDAGFDPCGAACVPTGTCCFCPVLSNGSGSCVGAACVITCDNGYQLCDDGETRSCIPNGGCCVTADCAGNPNGFQCQQHNCGCSGPLNCPPHNACDNLTQHCSTACVPGQPCNGGCCDGAGCVTGDSDVACGGTGGDCVNCITGAGICASGACVPVCSINTLVVNEVALGAGLTDWVELYNPCGAPVDLTGAKLVYRADSDSSDTVLALLDGKSIAANGFFVIANLSYSGAHDLGFITSISFSSSAGVGLRDAAAQRVDSVEWGAASANGFTEAVEATAPPAGESLARIPNGTDANDNHLDFQVRVTPTPGAAN